MKIQPVSSNMENTQFKGGMAKKIANFINGSKGTQKFLEAVNKNNALYSGAISFVLAGIMRPLAIGLFPFKDKQDKQVSQISAVSAGLVELGFTTAIFIPLNKCIENASKNLYKHKGSFFEGNNVALRSFKSVTNRSFKMMALIPMSLLRFGLIKPIMDNFTKKEEGNKINKWA